MSGGHWKGCLSRADLDTCSSTPKPSGRSDCRPDLDMWVPSWFARAAARWALFFLPVEPGSGPTRNRLDPNQSSQRATRPANFAASVATAG